MGSYLPDSLTRQIISELSNSDLVNLSLTKPFRLFAEEALYRSIPLFSSGKRLARFCKTITDRPSSARYVEAICIGEPTGCHDSASLPYLISAALTRMTEVRTLILCLESREHILLRFCQFSRLRVFSCVRVWDGLPKFLAHHQTIERLIISGSEEKALYLPRAALPKLLHFTGSGSVAGTAIPGRPVRTIQLTYSPYPLCVILPRVARSTGPANSLVLYLHGDLNVLDCVRVVSRYFPELKELVVHHGAMDIPVRVLILAYLGISLCILIVCAIRKSDLHDGDAAALFHIPSVLQNHRSGTG